MMNQKKSKNPNNPNNSSVVQALLDAKDNGFPTSPINTLLEFAKKNINILNEADAAFKKHNYPARSIEWSRIYKDVELEYFLSANEFLILVFFIKNMWTNNLVQASQNDIMNYTSIKSKGVVNLAIHNLVEKGCITIRFKGNNRQKTVYMVNPSLGTVGVEYKNSLAKIFWELTGTKFKDKEKDTEYSSIHKKWLELTAEQHYYRGRNSKDNINFVEVKEKTEKQKNNAKNEITNEINEDLPF